MGQKSNILKLSWDLRRCVSRFLIKIIKNIFKVYFLVLIFFCDKFCPRGFKTCFWGTKSLAPTKKNWIWPPFCYDNVIFAEYATLKQSYLCAYKCLFVFVSVSVLELKRVDLFQSNFPQIISQIWSSESVAHILTFLSQWRHGGHFKV